MRTAVLSIAILVMAITVATADVSHKEQKRLQHAASVLRDMQHIPPDILAKAECIGVIPSVKKAALVFGAEYGKGVVSCRAATGWSAPAFFELDKASWGLQVGGEMVDVVFLVMNKSGMDHLLQDKFALGASGSVTAGPVGRSASAMTDAQMRAEILSYSRSQGLFAGINLTGGVLMADKDSNADMYGPGVTARDILLARRTAVHPAAKPFMSALVQADREATKGRPAGDIR